jgi:hypothetical protein
MEFLSEFCVFSSEALRGFYGGFNVVSEVNEVDFGCFSMLVCLQSCKSDKKKQYGSQKKWSEQ